MGYILITISNKMGNPGGMFLEKQSSLSESFEPHSGNKCFFSHGFYCLTKANATERYFRHSSGWNGFKKDLMYCELFTCFAVNKLYSVLGVRNVCTKHQIKYFDWLILESEYNNRNRKLYDRK